MSSDRDDMDDGVRWNADTLHARAAAADVRADRRLAAAIGDFFLPDEARLDDRARATLAMVLSELVASVDGAVRQHAARLLAGRGAEALARLVGEHDATIAPRLTSAGLLRDADLMRELIGRVRQDLLGAALPVEAPEDADQPSFLARLMTHADGVVASAAMTLIGAESRRRGGYAGATMQPDLPAELHHRVVWWVAAALRERFAVSAGSNVAVLDRALADAALRSIAAHDEGDRLEATAMRLAAAIDAHAGELPVLLVESLADRRLSLFVAVLGHALGLDYADARDIVLDPTAERLWLVLRALELDRPAIARIGLALSEADPQRDIERFADALDGIVAMPAIAARTALAPLMLHPDYRAALLALGRGGRA